MADEKTQEATQETPATAEATTTESKANVRLSAKVQKIVDAVKELSLMEVSELVKALEDEFGVSAAAPVAMVAGAAAGASAPAEEQTEFDVILKESGSNKIGAIKAIRTLKPELGLGEAKQFVESAPQKVFEAVNKEDAQNAKKVLEEAGCVVELK